METLKKSPSTLKRQGSNMPSMPKPVMKRQGSSMEARAQIRVLKKQDTRSQLIAAAEQREKLVKAKSMARILTNEDTQVFAAVKLMKTLSSRFSPGLNEESQKEASARRTHNTKNHINHAKYQVEKKPTPLKKLVKKLEKKFKKPLKLLARLRKALQTLTQRPAFTVTIIGTVLLSCVVLALNAPYALYMTPRLSNTLDVLEILCTSIFTLESVIFLIADGPSHYLRSGPHVFELVIVIGCWVDIICKLEKLNFRYSSMLAMLRALRPLAALQIVPSMKLVLTGLSHAVLGLGTMAVIVMFFFVVAGLAGMQLFATYSRYRCFFNGTDASVLDAAGLSVVGAAELIGDLEYLSSMDTVTKYVSADGAFTSPGGLIDPSGHHYQNCAGPWAAGSGMQCNGESFFNRTGNLTAAVYEDIICADSTVNTEHWNFDSFPWTCVTLFQLISMVSWSDIMMKTQDATGWYAVIYFVLIIVFGQFVILNLIIAVLGESYQEAIEEAAEAARVVREQARVLRVQKREEKRQRAEARRIRETAKKLEKDRIEKEKRLEKKAERAKKASERASSSESDPNGPSDGGGGRRSSRRRSSLNAAAKAASGSETEGARGRQRGRRRKRWPQPPRRKRRTPRRQRRPRRRRGTSCSPSSPRRLRGQRHARWRKKRRKPRRQRRRKKRRTPSRPQRRPRGIRLTGIGSPSLPRGPRRARLSPGRRASRPRLALRIRTALLRR